MEWIDYEPLPTYARLQYPSPNGEHPLTPPAVRTRYRESGADLRVVVWCDVQGGLAGVRAGIDEVAWSLLKDAHVFLEFCRPGKGSGYLALSYLGSGGGTVIVAAASRYDERHISWARGLQKALHRATGAALREEDLGCDA
jgi:hypothetical protein